MRTQGTRQEFPALAIRNNSFQSDRGIMAEPVEHVTTTEARAGNRNPVNRVVLFASLALVVVVFAVILLVYA